MKPFGKVRDKLTLSKANCEAAKNALVETLRAVNTLLGGIPAVGESANAAFAVVIQLIDQAEVCAAIITTFSILMTDFPVACERQRQGIHSPQGRRRRLVNRSSGTIGAIRVGYCRLYGRLEEGNRYLDRVSFSIPIHDTALDWIIS